MLVSLWAVLAVAEILQQEVISKKKAISLQQSFKIGQDLLH